MNTTYYFDITKSVGIYKNDDQYSNSLSKIEVKLGVKKNILDYIFGFKDLSNKWDGYNAKKFNDEVIVNATNFIKETPEKLLLGIDDDNINPNPDGTVSIQWTLKDESLLSLDIGKSYANMFIRKPKTPVSFINNIKLTDNSFKDDFLKSLSKFISK